MPDLSQAAGWLPLVFLGLLYLAVFFYVILDGYDLGVGILFGCAHSDDEQQQMICVIGPFWDANETWLVLAIGLLLSAFPVAHGAILGQLYLPVLLMVTGLILRGAAFDFRVKAPIRYRGLWNRAFYAGSLLAGFSQGLILGRYISGFRNEGGAWWFSLFIGLALLAGYALLGATWLMMKTDGAVRQRAIGWARTSLCGTALGIVIVSLATPWFIPRVWDKWFVFPELFILVPLPLMTFVLIVTTAGLLGHMARGEAGNTPASHTFFCPDWMPFVCSIGIFSLAFAGLAYSLFPNVAGDQLDLWQAAADPASLRFLLIGVLIVLPCILFYTGYAHWVFRGKLTCPGQDEPY